MDTGTEDKIIIAARKVFTEKGYSGARTRDIAEEAGINLALLNYYFRSKEKLFKIIMEEQLDELFGLITPILQDKKSKIDEKIHIIADTYFDFLLLNPDLPLFIMSELRYNTENSKLIHRIASIFSQTYIYEQIRELTDDFNVYHILVNFIGMIVFPFVSKPVFTYGGIIKDEEFYELIQTQKKIVPLMIKSLVEIKI